MRLIDADTKIMVRLYNEEREKTEYEEMTVADYLDSGTEEGCPPTVVGWVSVKDRLPDKSGPYLVRFANAFVEHLSMKVYYWDAKIGYWRGSEAHSMIIGITHWMPLPPGPEVKDEI